MFLLSEGYKADTNLILFAFLTDYYSFKFSFVNKYRILSISEAMNVLLFIYFLSGLSGYNKKILRSLRFAQNLFVIQYFLSLIIIFYLYCSKHKLT